MSSEHTPGPWRVKEYRRHSEAVIANAAGDELATIDLACMPGAEADARLFAAAPDLLEACEAAFRELNEIRARDGVPWTQWGYRSSVAPEYFSSVVDALRAAIKKARGEP